MPEKKDQVYLTEEEWTEIYYALTSKKVRLETGDYGVLSDSEIKRWIIDLEKIIETIGPDGETAALNGVLES